MADGNHTAAQVSADRGSIAVGGNVTVTFRICDLRQLLPDRMEGEMVPEDLACAAVMRCLEKWGRTVA